MSAPRMGWAEVIAQAPRKGRILVVDDEVEVRRSLHRLVTRMGHSARAAASAEEADEWLANESFDVCLLDIELPRMSGTEFLGWALKREPELAVIMLTGLDLPEMAVRCMEAGARSYLVKPVEKEFLELALRDALAVRRILVERNDLAADGAWDPELPRRSRRPDATPPPEPWPGGEGDPPPGPQP